MGSLNVSDRHKWATVSFEDKTVSYDAPLDFRRKEKGMLYEDFPLGISWNDVSGCPSVKRSWKTFLEVYRKTIPWDQNV